MQDNLERGGAATESGEREPMKCALNLCSCSCSFGTICKGVEGTRCITDSTDNDLGNQRLVLQRRKDLSLMPGFAREQVCNFKYIIQALWPLLFFVK